MPKRIKDSQDWIVHFLWIAFVGIVQTLLFLGLMVGIIWLFAVR